MVSAAKKIPTISQFYLRIWGNTWFYSENAIYFKIYFTNCWFHQPYCFALYPDGCIIKTIHISYLIYIIFLHIYCHSKITISLVYIKKRINISLYTIN